LQQGMGQTPVTQRISAGMGMLRLKTPSTSTSLAINAVVRPIKLLLSTQDFCAPFLSDYSARFLKGQRFAFSLPALSQHSGDLWPTRFAHGHHVAIGKRHDSGSVRPWLLIHVKRRFGRLIHTSRFFM
jgi:hypothetical protein